MRRTLQSMGVALPKGEFGRGVATLVAGTAISQVLLAFSAPILTRLYDPTAVGTFAVASSIASVLIAVTCLRYEFAIPLPESDTAAANVLALAILTNLGMSFVVGCSLWLGGPWLLGLFGASVLAPYVLLVAVGQLGGGLVAAFTSWAVRTKTFADIAATRLTQSVIYVALQVGLGILGFGAPGLLIGDVGGRISGSSRLARAAWRSHASVLRGISWAGIRLAARRYRRFPIFSSWSALLNALGMEVPLLLLVALYGTDVGGKYALAQRVVALPVTLVATAVGQVFVAEAARLAREEPTGLRTLFHQTTRRLALLAIVPFAVLALTAPVLAEWVFGTQWEEAGLFVTILAPMYYVQLLASPTGGTLDVLERQELHLARELLRLLCVGGAVVIAAALRLSPLATMVVLSAAGCFIYAIYGLISWRALLNHRTVPGTAPGSSLASTDTGLRAVIDVASEPTDTQNVRLDIAVHGNAEHSTDTHSLGAGLGQTLVFGGHEELAWATRPVVDPRSAAVEARADTAEPGAGRPAPTQERRVQIAISDTARRPITLLIRAPSTYTAERRYVFDVMLREWLGLDYDLAFEDRPDVSIRLRDDPDGMRLTVPDVLFATPRDDWLTERSMPVQPLRRVLDLQSRSARAEGALEHPGSALPASAIPILFGANDATQELWQWNVSGLTLAIDVFGSVFFLLTRYEEIVRRIRDTHDRFPARASLAVDEGFLDRPIADEYVDLLSTAIRHLWPAATRRPSVFRLLLTHDVDEPWATLGRPVRTVARGIAGDVIRRRDPALAARRAASFVAAWSGRGAVDPYNTFDFLMDTSERYDLRSLFYFIAGNTAGEIDGNYRLSDPPVSRLLRRIHDRGHEVGLHASYGTHRSAELTQVEFEALKASCRAVGFDQPTWGVRQHFLRFENPQTWRNHESAGIDYDSTLGFAAQIGFRAGTCREYPLFDLMAERSLALRERPLLVMDTTLFSYLGLELDDAASRTQSIVDACRRHRGDAVLCFHNSRLTGSRHRAFYEELIKELVGH